MVVCLVVTGLRAQRRVTPGGEEVLCVRAGYKAEGIMFNMFISFNWTQNLFWMKRRKDIH